MRYAVRFDSLKGGVVGQHNFWFIILGDHWSKRSIDLRWFFRYYYSSLDDLDMPVLNVHCTCLMLNSAPRLRIINHKVGRLWYLFYQYFINPPLVVVSERFRRGQSHLWGKGFWFGFRGLPFPIMSAPQHQINLAHYNLLPLVWCSCPFSGCATVILYCRGVAIQGLWLVSSILWKPPPP